MPPLLGVILCWVAACTGAVAQTAAPSGGPVQQLAAELVILAGDVRRLQHEKPGPQETEGLKKRLLGGLSSLPLALRRVGADDGAIVTSLRRVAEKQHWPALADRIEALKQRYPFDVRPFIATTVTPEILEIGGRIHREVCAGCHANVTIADALLPARNLQDQLKSMPREEFAARLWLGVRGDKTTAYANPFSPRELAAMMAWYAVQR